MSNLVQKTLLTTLPQLTSKQQPWLHHLRKILDKYYKILILFKGYLGCVLVHSVCDSALSFEVSAVSNFSAVTTNEPDVLVTFDTNHFLWKKKLLLYEAVFRKHLYMSKLHSFFGIYCASDLSNYMSSNTLQWLENPLMKARELYYYIKCYFCSANNSLLMVWWILMVIRT